MADPKAATDPVAPPAAVPALPASITLSADYAWFVPSTIGAAPAFVQRAAGTVVTDPDEVAYLVSRGLS